MIFCMVSFILLSARQRKCASGSAVEHLLAKERVAGSIPVSRFFLFYRTFRYMPKNGTKQGAIFGIFLSWKLVDTDEYL